MEFQQLRNAAFNNELNAESINEIVATIVKKFDLQEESTENVKKEVRKVARITNDIETEYPLLPPEADDLTNAVKKKGTIVLGGKDSPAYENVALRKRVYQDIYLEVKREFGLIDERGVQMSYKKLKRKYLKAAIQKVSEYEPPIAILNDITAENEVDF